MKSVLVGVCSAIIAVTGLAMPAGATVNGGGYIAGNSGMSVSGWSKMGIKDGKFFLEGEQTVCMKANFASGGMLQFGNGPTATVPNQTLPSADTSNCSTSDAENTINNPPANSTVTISGVCDDVAAKLKANVTGTNVTVIVNSTGACKDDQGTPVATTPVVVTVNQNTPQPTAEQTSATTTTAPAATGSNDKSENAGAAELPKTGVDEAISAIVATILAGGAYAGTLAIRAFRARP